METDRYDIFISYRRDGGFETAKHLNDLLVRDGYIVSFDIDTLREGDFDETLLRRIDQCVDFILVVDKHTFDRTLDPNFNSKNDWLRTELAYALKLKKNIIPVLLSGVDGFPSNLPADIAGVITKNGPEYNKYYFDEFYSRLKSFLHCKPRNRKENKVVKHIYFSRRMKMGLLMLCVFILCFFVLSLLFSPNKIVLNVSEMPESLNGYTKDYIKQIVEETVPLMEVDANKKMKGILYCDSTESNSLQNENQIFFDAGLHDVKIVSSVNGIVEKVRTLIGKKDVCVNLSMFTETDSSFRARLQMTLWNGNSYFKWIESSKRNFNDNHKCIEDVIKKCAGYVTFAYSPAISVLYDYLPNKGVDEYKKKSPWKNGIYNDEERKNHLEVSISRGVADSSYCRLLLGNIYYYMEGINTDDDLVNKAWNHLKRFSDANPQYKKALKEYIGYFENLMNTKIADTDNGAKIIEILIKRNVVPINSICSQLVVVTDQERKRIEGKNYYKATVYTFEKNNNTWSKVFNPFRVNIGVEGIAIPNKKREGDNMTPSGFYPISFAFGKKKDISTKMEFREINENCLWVTDTNSIKYNQWIEDDKENYKDYEDLSSPSLQPHYKYAVVIDYNTHHIIKGKGSAIFMHVQPEENRGTAGCISMTESDIKSLIKWLDPRCHPHIYIAKQINY